MTNDGTARFYAAREHRGEDPWYEQVGHEGTESDLALECSLCMSRWVVVRDVEDEDEIGGYRTVVLASGYFDAAVDGDPRLFAARLFAEAYAAAQVD